MRCAAIVVLAVALACGVARAAGLPSANVAWVPAAVDADVDRAFAQARASGKPLLLYWGATWCPPCNQLKATLFNRQDFAARARSFVAVHVDGDRPGAQRLGQRFKVSGYPTLVLFTPDGRELTRLPGEVDAAQVLGLMDLGMANGRPVKAVLADALAGKPVAAGEWRMLAFYSWETDEDQLVAKDEVPAVLARLAAAASAADAETSTRLLLKALAATPDARSGKGLKPDAAARERVQRLLADPAATRAQMDVVGTSAADLVRALSADQAPGASPFVPLFDAALVRLVNDATLSRGDRLSALVSRIELARLGQPAEAVRVALPEALLKDVREHAARDDREITDAYERQAVVTGDAYALGLAGLWPESDALLKANLAKSHSPYYLMSQLGSNAKKLGRKDEALRWYREAWQQSTGPATRLQWGASYLGALVELAPGDAATIEKTAARLFAEAKGDAGAFEGRSLRSLQRAASRLATWNADGRRAAALQRLQAVLDGVCAAAEPGQRAACQALMKDRKPA